LALAPPRLSDPDFTARPTLRTDLSDEYASARAALDGRPVPPEPDVAERFRIVVEHARNAVSRFGQTDFESKTAKEEARKKILRTAERFGIDVDEDSNVKQPVTCLDFGHRDPASFPGKWPDDDPGGITCGGEFHRRVAGIHPYEVRLGVRDVPPQAEELGITSTNVEEMVGSPNPEIRRLLGREDHFGELLGLSNDWAFQVIRQVGNYAEVFERNLGRKSELGLTRGLNALWTGGGLLYAPPFR
jgi:hypothetical protein